MNNKLKGFSYVSAWIAAWLIFSSIINVGLITTNVYREAEQGVFVTFFTVAIIFIAGAISMYKEVFTSSR